MHSFGWEIATVPVASHSSKLRVSPCTLTITYTQRQQVHQQYTQRRCHAQSGLQTPCQVLGTDGSSRLARRSKPNRAGDSSPAARDASALAAGVPRVRSNRMSKEGASPIFLFRCWRERLWTKAMFHKYSQIQSSMFGQSLANATSNINIRPGHQPTGTGTLKQSCNRPFIFPSLSLSLSRAVSLSLSLLLGTNFDI